MLIRRVIDRLSCDLAGFFVHVDAKSDIGEFAAVRRPNVIAAERRIPVYWGEFSGVEATLVLMRQALAAPQRYDYFVYISGSDYPLRNKKYVLEFFQENRGTEFINLVEMPSLEAGKPLSRINTIRYPSTHRVLRLASRVLAKVGYAQRDYRRYLQNVKPFSGHTWWALTREACQYLVNFEQANPHFAQFFKDTFAPDEMFFHTILGNSPFKSKVRRNLWFEDWSAAGSHPALIGAGHLARFKARPQILVDDVYGAGEVLFARKFSDNSLEIIQQLDEIADQDERK